jgi:diguanylate cyclase (GGDEF)-like protein/PAS domain S-box-containing protein
VLAHISREAKPDRTKTIRRFGLLTGHAEPILDRITALAATFFNVPIAVISVLDDTHSNVLSGYGWDFERTPRALSFCNETIACDGVLVVPDAREDDRFRDNPFVTGDPSIRFYAGVPIVADGLNIGALCLIDWNPRTFDAAAVDFLDHLGKLVMEHFELHRLHMEAAADRNKLRAIIEASPIAIATGRVDGTMTSWNRAAEKLFGWSREEIIEKQPPGIPLELRQQTAQLRTRIVGGYFLRAFRTYRLAKNGKRIETELSAGPIRDAHRNVDEIVYMHVDVTDRLREQAVERNRYEILELAANDGPLQQLLDRLVANIESAIPGTIGSILRVIDGRLYHAASGKDMPAVYADSIDGVEVAPNLGSCGAAAYSGLPVIVENIATHPNWEAFRDLALPLGLRSCWSVPIRSGKDVVGTLAAYNSVPRKPTEAEMRALLEAAHVASIVLESYDARVRLEEMAHRDALTSLPNRTMFEDRLEKAIASARRTGSKVAVGMLDLDRFKVINDSLGHAVGDRLLQEVATRLQRSIREQDIVARMGGDEFLILLPEVDGRETIKAIGQRALESLSKVFAPDGNELFVRSSLGFSVYPEDASEPSQLIQLADRAMYEAKRSRSSIEFFDGTATPDGPSELTLEILLNHALENDELELVYQPIVRSSDWATVGAEALLRWNHPTLGTLPPARFIPIAEDTGLIIPIGKWILREACRFSRRWSNAGGPGRVSVNVSPRQFEDRDFVASVVDALRESGVEPSLLTLEITESLIMRSPAAAAVTLQHLRALGVRSSIDDFGSGYSSLNYLKRFPIDQLKIDRSFVAEIGLGGPETSSDEAIIGAIVTVGKALGGLAIVAEGVETEVQARFVRDAGCGLVQGYYFARPMKPEALLEREAATL